MKLTTRDWQKLQMPIILLLFTLLFGAGLIYYAMQYATNQQALLNQQNDALLVAKQKYLSSGTEKQQLETYLPKYKALIQQGLVGEEQRQRWIQALKSIQKEHKLFPVSYKIAPLENKHPEFANNIQPFEMHLSTMQVEYDLLHEEDILKLTESLAQQPFNNWLLRDCDLEKLAQPKTTGATMIGQCTIEWYTLIEPLSQ